MKKLLYIGGLAVLASGANAALLSTTYAGGNGLSANAMVFFDATVANGITVTALDVADDQTLGSTITLDVYVRSGTSAGFEQTSAGWTLVSSGTGTNAGIDVPSFVEMSDFTLGAGVWGIAVHYVGTSDPSYTNGNGTNQSFSDSELTLDLGSASNSTAAGFDGTSVFNPRVWNGGVYYDPVPEPATLSLLGLGALALLRKKRKNS